MGVDLEDVRDAGPGVDNVEQYTTEVSVVSVLKVLPGRHPFGDIGGVYAEVDINAGVGPDEGLDSPPQFGSGHRLFAGT